MDDIRDLIEKAKKQLTEEALKASPSYQKTGVIPEEVRNISYDKVLQKVKELKKAQDLVTGEDLPYSYFKIPQDSELVAKQSSSLYDAEKERMLKEMIYPAIKQGVQRGSPKDIRDSYIPEGKESSPFSPEDLPYSYFKTPTELDLLHRELEKTKSIVDAEEKARLLAKNEPSLRQGDMAEGGSRKDLLSKITPTEVQEMVSQSKPEKNKSPSDVPNDGMDNYEQKLRDGEFANLIAAGSGQGLTAPNIKMLIEKADRLRQKDIQDAENRKQREPEKYDDFLNPSVFEIFPELKKYLPEVAKIPYAPERSSDKLEDLKDVPAKEGDQQSELGTQPSEKEQAPVAEEKKSEAAPRAALEESDISKLISNVEQRERDAEFQKQLAKTRDAIMGAGLGAPISGDYEMYDKMIKKAKKPLEDIITKNQLQNEQAQNDPNSAISVFARKTLEDMGIGMQGLEKVPYSQIAKLYPNLINLINTKISAETKQKLAVAQVAEEKEKTKTKKEQTIANTIKTDARNMFKSKDFESYNNAKSAVDLIDDALLSKNSKIKDNAAFFNFVKAAQQDSSVVRDSDIKLLAGGWNVTSADEMFDKIKAKLRGSGFSKQELNQMKKVAQKIIQIKKQRVNNLYLKPIIEQSKAGNYNISESISPDILAEFNPEEIQQEQQEIRVFNPEEIQQEQQEIRVFKKQYAPGNIVNTQDGSRYIIQEDGKTGVKQ